MAEPVDRLIEARWVVPIEPAGVVLEDHAVAIRNGKIVGIAPQPEARNRYQPAQTTSLPEHALLPGLVNLHTHAAMTLMRGLADDLPLMEWLQSHIWPAEGRLLSAQFVHDGTALAAAEMLLGGVTCFNDMYFYPEAAAEAAVKMGIRVAAGILAIEFPTAYATDVDDYLRKGLASRDRFRDERTVHFCLAPHAPYTVTDASFSRIATLAEHLDLPIHVHIHETRHEVEESERQHGSRPLARLQHLGLLSPRFIGVHAVHLNAEEIALLAEHGCAVAHCPTSNLKLASGIAPLAALDQAGVCVGLGTDGAASHNRLDLWQEMRTAALLAKGASGDAKAINAHRALAMATLQGARALGLDDRIGSICAGKEADLCAIRLDAIEQQPVYDVASHLVYVCGREHISDVWVAGTPRVAAGRLVDENCQELMQRTRSWQNRIRLIA